MDSVTCLLIDVYEMLSYKCKCQDQDQTSKAITKRYSTENICRQSVGLRRKYFEVSCSFLS